MRRVYIAAAVVLIVLSVAGIARGLSGSPYWVTGLLAMVLLLLTLAGLVGLAARQRERLHEAKRALARSEIRAQGLIEASPDGVALLSGSQVVFANRAFRQLLALPPEEEVFGRDFLSLVGTTDRRMVGDWLQRRFSGVPEPERLEFQGLRQTGAEVPLEAMTALLPTPEGRQLALFLRDLSGRRTLEMRLRHLTRLEAFADLGESVAREFDGIFRKIRRLAGGGEEDEVTETRPESERLEAIERHASRGRALVRRVRALAPEGPDASTFKHLDLIRLVREVAADFLRALPAGVSLRVNTEGPQRLIVLGDGSQLRQAFWQILENARQAQQSGEIQVRTRVLTLDEPSASLRPGSHPGPYAVLEVRDEGSGMTEEVKTRAFEPFFSTKGDRASGLGLTLAFGTVRSHGGFIEIDSIPARGTLVRIALPRLPEESLPAEIDLTEQDPKARWRGRETILLVDDHPLAREEGRRILEEYGYHCEVAGDPREALVRLRQKPEVDLVALDMVLPGFNGPDLVRKILRHWPGQRVLMLCPYPLREQAELALRLGAVGVFERSGKERDELARAVRAALDGPPPAPQ